MVLKPKELVCLEDLSRVKKEKQEQAFSYTNKVVVSGLRFVNADKKSG